MPYFVRLPLCYFVTILIFKCPCINYDLFCFPKERLSEVIECGAFCCFFFNDEYFKSVPFPSEESSAPPASAFSSIQKNKHREELK